MNSIEGALFTFLQSDPTISSYVGGGTTGVTARIYPMKVKQPAVFPCMSYHIIHGDDVTVLNVTDTKMAFKRIQISVWSDSVTLAKTILEAVRVAISPYAGLWDDVPVSVVSLNQAPDNFDHIAKIFQVAFQITLWHGKP